MKRFIMCLGLIVSVNAIATQTSAAAKADGLMEWQAMSNTASSITGNIKISSDKLTIAGVDYPLTLAKEIDAQHLSDAGKIVSVTKPTQAHLYKIKIPATAKLVNGNTICGAKDANWLLTITGSSPPYQNDQGLSLAFFSDNTEHNLDYKAVSSSTGLCGTYGYNH